MAIFHLTVKTGKKGYGLSHALYIARDGKYANRGDCTYVSSGNLPMWAMDDDHFWNTADLYERENGRVYTEIEFSLPRELTHEQQIVLAHEYAKNIVGNRHTYTFAIHEPNARDNSTQPHVHFMFSERVNDGIERTESQYFKRYNRANPELGGAGKDRVLNSKFFVSASRTEWTLTANLFFEKNGLTIRIDHRSYAKMGTPFESQNMPRISKIGNQTIANLQYQLSQDLMEKQRRNGERIIADPNAVLTVLTSNGSTFTKNDLQRFIFSHTDGEQQYTEAYNAVIHFPEFQKLAGTEQFTTREMFEIEKNIIERVQKSNENAPQINAEQFNAQQNVIAKKTFNPEQKIAFKNLTSNAQITSVNGAAGTGKSYVLSAVNDYYQQQGKNVYGVALQAITAQSMQNDAGIASTTIADFLHKIEKGQIVLNQNSIIVLDEAGMVGSRDMQKLLEKMQNSGANIRMVGDSKQLSAVSAGNAYANVQHELTQAHQSTLVKIMRQNDETMKQASMDLSRHNISDAVDKYQKLGKLTEFKTQDCARLETVNNWYNSDSGNKIMLAYTNNDVNALNNYARVLLKQDWRLGHDDHQLRTEKGLKNFSENDSIIFKTNNRELGIFNGTRATISSFGVDDDGGEFFIAETDDGRLITINPNEYKNFTHAYATTIHGSQGITVQNTYLLASKQMNANLAYVGMTRHKNDLQIAYSREEFDSGLNGLKTEFSRADIKTFTGDQQLDCSFNDIRDEFCVDKRETFSEKRTEQISQVKPVGQSQKLTPIEQVRLQKLRDKHLPKNPDGTVKTSAQKPPEMTTEQRRQALLAKMRQKQIDAQITINKEQAETRAGVALSKSTTGTDQNPPSGDASELSREKTEDNKVLENEQRQEQDAQQNKSRVQKSDSGMSM